MKKWNVRIGGLAVLGLLVLAAPAAAVVDEVFTTLFSGGNQFAGNMFDLKATNPAGLEVKSWDVNIDFPSPDPQTPVNISIYWRPGSYLAGVNTQTGWNHLGTEAVISAGENNPTHVPVGGLALPFDETIGVYVFVTDYIVNPPPPNVPAMNYTNIPPANTMYSDANLTLTGGVGKGSPPFTGSTFNNRMWNGNIEYNIIPEPTTLALFGLGVMALVRRR